MSNNAVRLEEHVRALPYSTSKRARCGCKALIEDDRFTQTHDLLKKNTERAQKLVQVHPLEE